MVSFLRLSLLIGHSISCAVVQFIYNEILFAYEKKASGLLDFMIVIFVCGLLIM